eukprot:3438758-Pyramimonas_sp.AAC.2
MYGTVFSRETDRVEEAAVVRVDHAAYHLTQVPAHRPGLPGGRRGGSRGRAGPQGGGAASGVRGRMLLLQ